MPAKEATDNEQRRGRPVGLFLAVLALPCRCCRRIDGGLHRCRDGCLGVPGLAYAVVSDGTITSAGAYGVVRKGADREVTPDTWFLTGSISKSFTALAVVQLVEAGKVDLGPAVVSSWPDSRVGRSP